MLALATPTKQGGARAVEQVRYAPYGEPACYAAADINLDSVVDDADKGALTVRRAKT